MLLKATDVLRQHKLLRLYKQEIDLLKTTFVLSQMFIADKVLSKIQKVAYNVSDACFARTMDIFELLEIV